MRGLWTKGSSPPGTGPPTFTPPGAGGCWIAFRHRNRGDWETSLEATLSLTASEDLVDLVQPIQRLEPALNCSQRLEPARRTQWQMQQLGLPSFFYPYCSCAWPFWCSEFCSVDQTITVQRGSVLDVRGPEWFIQSFCSLWISTVLGEQGGLY